MSAPVIYWFRRDLRLTDNLALHAAHQTGALVIPLFIFDPALLTSRYMGGPRLAFLPKALAALDASLREHGSRLLIRHGNPLMALSQLVNETGATALYYNRDYSPFARRRDQIIHDTLPIPVHSYDDALLLAPSEVLKSDNTPYMVFTPFKKQWRSLPKTNLVETPHYHFHDLTNISGSNLPTLAELGFTPTIPVPDASESLAQRRLSDFAGNDLYHYSTARNTLVTDPFAEPRPIGSSYLSPYLRFGLLSPRQVYWAARNTYDRAPNTTSRDSVSAWVDELIWREFYTHILHHFPHVSRGNFRPEYTRLPWRAAPDELQAWQDGQTGYPVVDAAMRQLQHTGWLPNRARMIVASFLTKDLLIHWQSGELHFMRWLIDGDPAANNGGWQWTAGTGTDAQPYFRIFNPISQSQKFDPNGDYIRYWLPELRNVPAPAIHAPWEMETPPANYPPPIVPHHIGRERALLAFHALKRDNTSIENSGV